MTTYCPRCGAQTAPSDNFCGSCASPIARGPVAEAQPPFAAPMQQPQPFASTAASMGNVAAGNAAPAAALQPNLPQPPFGAPPPGMLPGGGYAVQPLAPAPAAPAMPVAQPAIQPPAAAAGPYGPAPSPAQPIAQPNVPAAGKCDFGHDIPQGSSYCNFGHPIALGDMKFAGGDAFGATAYPADTPAAAPAPLPPTGAMSPFPHQQPPPAPAPKPPYGFNAQPAAQPMAFAQSPQPQPVAPVAPEPVAQPQPAAAQQPPWPAQAQQTPAVYEALAATTPAGAVRRQLRGFLFSFHADSNGMFWPLFMGRNTLGRAGSGEMLEIEIADPTTSSRHATITGDANAVVLEDEGSTNGSFVNDQPVGYKGKIELHDGDRIRFGAYNAAVRLITR